MKQEEDIKNSSTYRHQLLIKTTSWTMMMARKCMNEGMNRLDCGRKLFDSWAGIGMRVWEEHDYWRLIRLLVIHNFFSVIQWQWMNDHDFLSNNSRILSATVYIRGHCIQFSNCDGKNQGSRMLLQITFLALLALSFLPTFYINLEFFCRNYTSSSSNYAFPSHFFHDPSERSVFDRVPEWIMNFLNSSIVSYHGHEISKINME